MTETSKPKNFSDGSFRNTRHTPRLKGGKAKLRLAQKMLFTRPAKVTPSDKIPVMPVATGHLEEQRAVDGVHLYRLGHSAILMKFGTDYWLTDPMLSNRASPFRYAGPKRFHQPPLGVDDLPKIKGVIISHNHYDHLDKSTIKRLAHKVEKFITPLGVAKYLMKWGVPAADIIELDWWQSHDHGTLTVTATPSQHFSGRSLTDTNKSLWASFCIRHQGTTLFFGSDSGYFEGFAEIGKQFGPFDLAMLECGAYDESWPHMHMTPPQTMQAFKDLGGGTLMPIHNGTFSLAFHGWREPLEHLTRLAEAERIHLLTPHFGERVVVGAPIAANPWWEGLR